MDRRFFQIRLTLDVTVHHHMHNRFDDEGDEKKQKSVIETFLTLLMMTKLVRMVQLITIMISSRIDLMNVLPRNTMTALNVENVQKRNLLPMQRSYQK